MLKAQVAAVLGAEPRTLLKTFAGRAPWLGSSLIRQARSRGVVDRTRPRLQVIGGADLARTRPQTQKERLDCPSRLRSLLFCSNAPCPA
jgi:hypothetical protein